MSAVLAVPQRPSGRRGPGSGRAGPAERDAVDEAGKVDEAVESLCPVCLDNEDGATVDGEKAGSCWACGQFYCGACKGGLRIHLQSPTCPTCRAPLVVTGAAEHFERVWRLVHDRSPGRHTPAAQYHLGCKYYYGEGVQQDFTEAAKWYRLSGRSADHAQKDAQFILGTMHARGEGVEQDCTEAFKWYRLSALQGHPGAQNNLGSLLYKGHGVEQDHVESVKWYRRSAANGHAGAQFNLGFMYRNGTGVEQDFAKAVKWTQMAELAAGRKV